ncbi:MAG TPA: AMP-binding protein [Steroidobacteraceae bacterium]
MFTGRDVPWLLRTRAATRSDHTFLVWEPFEGQGARWTYAEFAAEVGRVAAGLASRGIHAGDCVLIHLGNCPEFLFTWFACSQLGAIAVTTNTRSALDELSYFASNSRAVAAITQPELLDLVREACPELRWIACTETDLGAPAAALPDGIVPFAALRARPGSVPARPAEPMAPNSVQYTSGTTSRPKGVVWTHANALWGAKMCAHHLELTEHDVTLAFLPLFHTNALAYSMLSTLWSGGTLVVQPKFSASRFWDAIVRNGCTWNSTIPFALFALMKHPAPKEHKLRFFGLGASDVPVVKQLWNTRSLGWFGMTETISWPLMAELGWPNREMAMGVPTAGYEVKVVREDGSEVDFGESGHLKIRGMPGISLFLEYLGNPQATAEAFDAEGWFSTGDLVTPFEDGHVRFDTREKDMLRVGAENVSAAEVERVILACGGITEAAVVARPDRMLEEVPVAYVIPIQPDATLAERVLEQCRKQLADFKVPRQVFVVDDLPRVTLGKIDKKTLRLRLREAFDQEEVAK